jgi:hypothetical protein
MPRSADMLLLFFGAILLAAGLFGGGTKIFSVEVPIGFGGKIARLTALALGLMMLGVGLYLTLLPPAKSPANATALPNAPSREFCLTIKSQWETKKSWSNQDDENLRRSFQNNRCPSLGLTIP